MAVVSQDRLHCTMVSFFGLLHSQCCSLVVLLTNSGLAVVYSDRSKMDYFYFTKRPTGEKKTEKLASYDPRVCIHCLAKGKVPFMKSCQ